MTNEEAADRLTRALIKSVIGVTTPEDPEQLAEADDGTRATEMKGAA
jgi:hypothetical protein